MISVGTDDREVHVLLLANLAWHRRQHGSEHSSTAIEDMNPRHEIAIAKRHRMLLQHAAWHRAVTRTVESTHQFNDCSGSVEHSQVKLVPRARRSLPLAEDDRVAYHEGPGTRLAHDGGGKAELAHTAQATRAEGQSFARLQDVGVLSCRRTKRLHFRFGKGGPYQKK